MNIIKYLLLSVTLVSVSSCINAQELSVFPGFLQEQYYQDNNQISKQEFMTLLDGNAESKQLMKKSRLHTGLTIASVGAQLGFVVWGGQRIADEKDATLPLVGLIGSSVAGVLFAYTAMNSRKLAILNYNSSFDDIGTLNFGPTTNGLGLVLEF